MSERPVTARTAIVLMDSLFAGLGQDAAAFRMPVLRACAFPRSEMRDLLLVYVAEIINGCAIGWRHIGALDRAADLETLVARLTGEATAS